MKKIILTSVLALASAFSFAQSDATVIAGNDIPDDKNVVVEKQTTVNGDTTTVVTTTTRRRNGKVVSTVVKTESHTSDGWRSSSTEINNGTNWSIRNSDMDTSRFKCHMEGVFLGLNNYIFDGKMDPPADAPWMELRNERSMNLDLYFGQVDFIRNPRWFSIYAGFDIEFNHYGFKKSFNLINNDGTLVADYSNVPQNGFKRMNLRTMYAGIPLMMEFQMKNYKGESVYLTAGVKGQVRIGSRTKQIWNEDGDRQKNRVKDDFNTSLFRYSYIGGIGYGDVQIFGEYCPVGIFREGKGPDLKTFSIGVKLNM